MTVRVGTLGAGTLAFGLALGLTGCANILHKNEIQTAARTALADAGLTAGAEAFDTGEGLADRYNLLVCAVVPRGQEYDDRALARVVVDALNAVRDTALGHEGRITGVSIRLTSEDTEQKALNKWCRGDTRRIGIGGGAIDFVSLTADRLDWDTADFEVPYPEAELQQP